MDKDTIKPLYSKKFQEKRTARILAIQAVYAYQYDSLTHLDNIILNLINDSKKQNVLGDLSKSNEKHLINLVRGVVENLDSLIKSISPHLSKEWRFDRLGKVMQSILLVGSYELMMDSQIDKPVVLNEYIEIAKLFNHEGEAGFVNSVLDAISNSI